MAIQLKRQREERGKKSKLSTQKARSEQWQIVETVTEGFRSWTGKPLK